MSAPLAPRAQLPPRGGGFGRGRLNKGAAAASSAAPSTFVPSANPVAAVEGSSSTDEIAQCVVCADPLVLFCISPCGHNDVCGMCVARLRILGRDRSCLFCKTPHDHAVVSRIHDGSRTAYSDFGIFGDHGGPSLTLDEASGLFFHTSADADYSNLIYLRQYRCGVTDSATAVTCTQACGNMAGLSKCVCVATENCSNV